MVVITVTESEVSKSVLTASIVVASTMPSVAFDGTVTFTMSVATSPASSVIIDP